MLAHFIHGTGVDASNLVNFLYVFVVVISGLVVDFREAMISLRMVVEQVSVMVELRIIG